MHFPGYPQHRRNGGCHFNLQISIGELNGQARGQTNSTNWKLCLLHTWSAFLLSLFFLLWLQCLKHREVVYTDHSEARGAPESLFETLYTSWTPYLLNLLH